jgi:hypothetical protein
MTHYLIETRREDETALRVFGPAELMTWLRREIEQSHFSGEDSYDSAVIYRYHGGGKLTRLALECQGRSVTEDDWMHIRYALYGPAAESRKPELAFTVTLNGRS